MNDVNFLNSQISLFHFEDDTFRPVIIDLETDIEYIKKLYDECNIPLEIEPTTCYVKYRNNPFGDKILYNIKNDLKKNFVENYLPLLSQYKELIDEIGLSEELFYFSNYKNINFEKDKKEPKNNESLIAKLAINIPDNIAEKKMDELKDKKTEYIQKLFPKYEKSSSQEKNENVIAFNSHLKCNSYILKGKHYPYNEIFNSLYPEFSDNCCLITDNSFFPYNNNNHKTEEKKETIKNVVVILNVKYWNTKVLENPFLIHLDMLNKHPEYGFLKLFSLQVKNEKIVKTIYEKLDNIIFENAADLNKTLNFLSDFIYIIEEDDYNTKCRNDEYELEEELVRDFLNHYYEISNDAKDKINLSAICKIIQGISLVSIKENGISAFQNRLSKYLSNLGWKRKYFQDGFYYYGIKERFYGDLKKGTDKCFKDDKNLDAVVTLVLDKLVCAACQHG